MYDKGGEYTLCTGVPGWEGEQTGWAAGQYEGDPAQLEGYGIGPAGGNGGRREGKGWRVRYGGSRQTKRWRGEQRKSLGGQAESDEEEDAQFSGTGFPNPSGGHWVKR